MSDGKSGSRVYAAAYHGKLPKLRKLLEAEDEKLRDCPSVNFVDASGATPLHAACQQGHTDCVDLLISAGAPVEAVGAGGVTPLIVACDNGRGGCVERLLAAKANPAAVDKENAATALHGASMAGDEEIVRLLIEARAPVDAVDAHGATPLIIAAHNGHAPCVRALYEAGADASPTYDGMSALAGARAAGHAECAAILEGAEGGQSDGGLSDGSATGGSGRDADGLIGPPRPPAQSKPAASSGRDISSMLSEMGKAVEGSGMTGSELFRRKEMELERANKEAKEAEEAAARKKAEEAADLASRPQDAAGAKAAANALFAQGKVERAATMYVHALECAAAELVGEDGREIEEVVDTSGGEPPLRAVINCNLAACRLRQRRWRDALDACDAACELYPTYTKALFRRAQARRALKEYDAACDDAALARAAACRAGGGAPVGDGVKLVEEVDRFVSATKKEEAEAALARERDACEQYGITLGAADESGDKSVYYHYASQGEKTQDFMWWVKATLRSKIPAVSHENAEVGGAIRVVDFDESSVEGNCTIRSHDGRRSLFFELSLRARWRAVLGEGSGREEVLCGGTKLWGINHFTQMAEWKHLNERETHESRGGKDGPAQTAMAQMLAPAIAAKLKLAVQEVVGELMLDRIDPAMLAGPAKPAKPKPKPSVRKGTTDYSKWDALSSDDDEAPGDGMHVNPDLDLYAPPPKTK